MTVLPTAIARSVTAPMRAMRPWAAAGALLATKPPADAGRP